MIIKIIKSNFKIYEENIKPTLKALTDRYPEIKQHLLYKQRAEFGAAEQLQIALYLMGYHVRVMPPGSIIDMKSILTCALVPNDFHEVMRLMSQFTTGGSYLEIAIDENEPQVIKFDELKNTPMSVKEVEVEVKPPVKRGRPRTKK